MKHAKPQTNPCPMCGLATEWDSSHVPPAWRHVETDSHWCTTDDNPIFSISAHNKDRLKGL